MRGRGFRLERISPADGPRLADFSIGDGWPLDGDRPEADEQGRQWLRLVKTNNNDNPEPILKTVSMPSRAVTTQVVAALDIPPSEQTLVVSRAEGAESHAGRAGMGYRDLLPNRFGGSVIASHITIDTGGPVPDYVHYHAVGFQLIFCQQGWVRVAYEDQGPPIVMEAGDCVVQPPGIRHRVLESSAGLQVVEVGTPAEHDTFVEHEITLPTGIVAPDRDFAGQRFVFHQAADAKWEPSLYAGHAWRDSGIGEATAGAGGVRVIRPADAATTGTESAERYRHDGEFLMLFALSGTTSVHVGDEPDPITLGESDSVAIPAETPFSVTVADGELLEVTVPAHTVQAE